MKRILIKYLKRFLYVIFLLLICLCGLEICFRYQVIDFYQSELKGLNSEEQLNANKENVLVFGDSFSAHPESYVSQLRENFPSTNFINSAIPGTGIKQHQLIFKKRITKYRPKAIIYQFYVGNDFTDIKHPINFKEVSFLRNVFWKISERFLVLQYINHRLAFLNSNNQAIEQLQEKEFSKALYNNRVKIYYKADKNRLNNTILLEGEKTRSIYATWKEKVSALVNDSIPVFLLMVPHNAQVNNMYLNRNKNLGASLSSAILKLSYPLIKEVEEDFGNWNVINPLVEFQQHHNNERLFYQNDPHLTAYGQKELSKIVLNKLASSIE